MGTNPDRFIALAMRLTETVADPTKARPTTTIELLSSAKPAIAVVNPA
jgi:hypothetical protein